MRRKAVGAVIILLVLGLLGAYQLYSWIYTANTALNEEVVIYLPRETSYDALKDTLLSNTVLENYTSFDWTAKLMKSRENRTFHGRYVIHPGMSNRQILQKLRISDQNPLMVTISTGRTMADIYRVLSLQLEADSLAIQSAFESEETSKKTGAASEQLIALIIPNSYEMFWTATPRQIADRFITEHEKFWNANGRKQKCDRLSITPFECSTLASIVEKESNIHTERPTIAGVYLNRLERGIPLQADPTVVFAVGDFDIRRVLNRHLEIDSPYNTYKNAGLPPGPICMPSISSIDAVLNAEDHDFLFFCAKPGYSGEHLFAKTNREHERNARVYRNWLDNQKIKS